MFPHGYVALWAVACVAAMVICVRQRQAFAWSHRAYWQYLLTPWKGLTFLVAACGITVIAPYTGDPTWDYFDALFMSIFTFLSAPWAVGALYKSLRGNLGLGQAYVALCFWMFSASWSYDLYLLIRDGVYPITWYSNIYASSVLYVSAGLLWNLEWAKEKGVVFGFMQEDWPAQPTENALSKVIWYALPFMALAAFLIVYFFLL